MVLDIDETALYGHEDQADNITVNPEVKSLYDNACEKNVCVLFITARPYSKSNDAWTRKQLSATGYQQYDHLHLRPPHTRDVGAYKLAAREAFEKQGYHILMNVGDQPTDIVGGGTDVHVLLPDLDHKPSRA